MQVADGFEVSLVASEPEIRQPVSITFDDRGRMWVIQYIQYPTPAGLNPVSVDNYLRTKYDRVPEPPPRGPKGADRITICELSPDHRHATRFKDFVNGLNLCSGLALGHGGAFVLSPPYLLFYPDKNHDDVPDSDPEVLLTGFGMEDAHAVANSLTWGPDGWLYGAQGSTVTAHIRNLEFQQGIWRYHPVTKEFELFAEGGGNTWGLDFNEDGEVIAGTNFDEKMLHQIQGAYYVKNFGKHGELHNPYTYGYFGHVPYTGYRGRHISCGGIVYQGGAFPASFANKYIFANVLDHAVYWASMQREGSSFTASFGGPFLKSDDEQFRPVDCETGPDGAVYIADWCDRRASHVDPLDTWDRSNGRIYRVQCKTAPGTGQIADFNLSRLSSDQLVDLLADKNDWFARKARTLLCERHDPSVLPRLHKQLRNNSNPHLALQSFWAVCVSGGFDEKLGRDLLKHPNQNIRAWAVRLLCDPKIVSKQTAHALVSTARFEKSPTVRSQLACSAKRLAGETALPIVAELLRHDEDTKDQHIPMLLWWVIEDKAINSRSRLLDLFAGPELWHHTIPQKFILQRIARRYADEGGNEGFKACTELLDRAPETAAVGPLLKGIDEALAGRKLEHPPSNLQRWFAQHGPQHIQEISFLRVGLRIGNSNAPEAALHRLKSETASEQERIGLIEVLGETQNPESASPFLGLLKDGKSEKLREAALAALQHLPQPEIAQSLLEQYPRLTKRLQQRDLTILSSRPPWALQLVKAVEAGSIDAKEVSLDNLKQMAALQNDELKSQLEKRWGRIQSNSPEEKKNSINRLRLTLNPSGIVGRDPKGNPGEGRKVFQTTCAICHKLFDEGNSVGPDLTTADRKNTEFLLAQIVDPSAYIRPEFIAYRAKLTDDTVLDGLMVDSNASSVTLVDRNNERHVLARTKISELKESPVSLMPEGLLEALSPQAVMDLFAYLQANGPGVTKANQSRP